MHDISSSNRAEMDLAISTKDTLSRTEMETDSVHSYTKGPINECLKAVVKLEFFIVIN